MKKNKIAFFIISLSFFCFIHAFGNPVTISLGPNCVPALFLRHYHIRTEAYPFDWVVCSYTNMYDLITNDFKNYMIKDNLIIDPKNPYFVNDTYTGVRYNHDFPTKESSEAQFNTITWQDSGQRGPIIENFLDFYEIVYEKYQRRIERFKEICRSNKSVLFFCCHINKVEAVQLRNLISDKYPNLDFRIIVVNAGFNNQSKTWCEANIENYSSNDNFWDLSSPDWKNILEDLNLI